MLRYMNLPNLYAWWKAVSLVTVVASTWLVCSSANAQDASSADTIEAIVATGSRLRRGDLDAPSPTVIVGEEDVRLSGQGTIEGLLNELPQLTADRTSSTQNIGQSGLHTANLSATYLWDDSIELHAIVKNVLDKWPQLTGQGLQGDAGADVGLYDVLG